MQDDTRLRLPRGSVDSTGAGSATEAPTLKSVVLGAVGNTPLVELLRPSDSGRIRVYAKLEGLNPGGSAKDRPALSLVLG